MVKTTKQNYMNSLRLLLLMVSFSLHFVLFAQETTINLDSLTIDSTIPPSQKPEQIYLGDYNVKFQDNQLFFSSGKINGIAHITINKEKKELVFNNGIAQLPFETTEKGQLLLLAKDKDEKNYGDYQLLHIAKQSDGSPRQRRIPLWLSILPPLIAIALALIFKEVIVSLFIGIWAGAFIVGGMRFDSLYYIVVSFWEVVEKYVISSLADSDHMSVIVFSLLIGGMVAIISRNGGMAGVVNGLSRYARGPVSSQFITWLLGVAIFFDDYANTLIVGNTMRSVTDKFKISREKLAYIVDSTAAPVSAVAFITTWIGAELGYIQDGIGLLEGYNGSSSAYSLFLSSLKYSFYPILTLIFILIIIFSRKDYGKMYQAEVRARTTGQVSPATSTSEDEPNMEDLTPVKGAPLKWYNAAIPVLLVILMTIFGLIDTGIASTYSQLIDANIPVSSSNWGDTWGAMGTLLGEENSFFMKIGTLIGNSNSYTALLWASLTGVTVALLLTVFGRIMKLHDAMHTMTMGFKTMLPALIILTLAWSLAILTKELHTATYLTSALQGNINPYLMPPLIFILAALIAFSTGSSWSTMAILYPIAIPTAWAICTAAGMSPDISLEILLNVIAVTLAASVLGDHCSPISDTTILSSLASDCNHIDHVRTQLPYALTVGVISLACAFISTLLGGGWGISLVLLIISVAILFGVVRIFGKRVE